MVHLGQIGIGFSILALLSCLPKKSPYGYVGVALIGLALNATLLILGKGLDRLLIHSLPSAHLPQLVQSYEDPSHIFRMKVPMDWTPEPGARNEWGTSVHLKPAWTDRGTGINEIDVFVRPLRNSPQNAPAVFNQLVDWMKIMNAQGAGKKTEEMSVTPERVTLADGNFGLHLKLETKEWWIPVREDVLYAAQPGRFLCMIACSGLAGTVAAYYPLSVKLYESIRITPI